MFETIHHFVIICCCFFPTNLLLHVLFHSLLRFTLLFLFSTVHSVYISLSLVLVSVLHLSYFFIASYFLFYHSCYFLLHIRVFFNSPVYYTRTFKLISNVFIVVSMKKRKKTITMFDNLFSLNVFICFLALLKDISVRSNSSPITSLTCGNVLFGVF